MAKNGEIPINVIQAALEQEYQIAGNSSNLFDKAVRNHASSDEIDRRAAMLCEAYAIQGALRRVAARLGLVIQTPKPSETTSQEPE